MEVRRDIQNLKSGNRTDFGNSVFKNGTKQEASSVDMLHPLQMFSGNLSEFGEKVKHAYKVQFGQNVINYS